MKAIVIAALENANAVLPPMDGDGTETQLVYLVDGVRTGGSIQFTFDLTCTAGG